MLRAESLVEVIVALFVVALSSGTATTLVVSGLQSNTYSREALIASGLAKEGIEAMRIIRDSNWLKFGYDKANCWNMYPEKALGDECEGVNLIEEGFYTVDLNSDAYSWTLTKVDVALDLKGNLATNDAYLLGFLDLTPGDTEDEEQLYVTNAFLSDNGLPTDGESKFYRMIEIKYLDSPAVPDPYEKMMVRNTIQWKAGATVHNIVLTAELANYATF